MASTFFGLSIATSGLYASQASMNTTAHNIANQQTEGFCRQENDLTAAKAVSLSSSYGMIGTGVNTVSVTQCRDAYYDTKYRSNQAIAGNYSTKEYYFLSIENVISETNSKGINSVFDRFTNSLSELQNNAKEASRRNQVANMASGFTDFVNAMANSLESLQGDCNDEIKTSVQQINSYAQQVATISKQINTIELTGENANDLRDQRNLILDKLSEYANITTSEMTEQNGRTTIFEVRLDGKLLVDNYSCNLLEVTAKETYNNQCDIKGLYKIQWANGQYFNESSATLGGKLQALFEVRDGNNITNFNGTANGTNGINKLMVSNANCNDITKLNIPAEKGVITIGIQNLEYESFDVTVDATGNYAYEFTLKEPLKQDIVDKDMYVGKKIDCKGIPYYINELTQLSRTYAKEFNEIHNQGQDINGNAGQDFFTGIHSGSELNFDMVETDTSFSFSSHLPTDAAGNIIVNGDGRIPASYYNITCENLTVASSVKEDSGTIATSENMNNGVDETKILDQLVDLKSRESMFKQGTPSDFIQKLTSDCGTDTDKVVMFSKSQDNIVDAVNTQRLSVSSVDQDEESMGLVKFQNAYNLNSKVIQTMNQLFNVLINGLGI